MKSTQEIEVKPANLWSKIKAQCLQKNPFLGTNDDGQAIMKCPRCEKHIGSTTYKFCPNCGIKLHEDAEYATYVWIDGYYVGNGL